MNKDNNAKLKAIFAKIMQIAEEEITDKTSMEQTPAWDSFNALMLISEVEKEFGIQLTTDEAISLKNIEGIKQILTNHNIKI